MVVCPMAMGLMEKLALTNPAGIVTLAGTVAMAGLEDERATLVELATAARDGAGGGGGGPMGAGGLGGGREAPPPGGGVGARRCRGGGNLPHRRARSPSARR